MTTDSELLRHYARDQTEASFAEVVRRHVDLVYSSALRQVNGDAHLAQDVTQQVFVDLARKAERVAGGEGVAGWLFVSARFAAAKAVRGEQRRRAREAEAESMNQPMKREAGAEEWERVRPVLDAAIDKLKAADREAVLLRFFEGRAFAEIGAQLRVTENAARMRVERALEKLRGVLAGRGVTSTTAALAIALEQQAVAAAPAGLAVSTTTAALAGAGAAAGGGLIATGFMAIGKMKLAVLAAIAAGGVGGLVWQQRANARLAGELEGLRTETSGITALQVRTRQLADRAAEVASLRADDAELARLATDASALSKRIEIAARPWQRVAARNAAGAQASKIYDAGALDRQPVAQRRVPPRYPAGLSQAGVEGEAVVSFVVGADGAVRDVRVVRATQPDFGAAAMEALKQWRFQPGLKGGAPVNARVSMPMRFTVETGKRSVDQWF
jgi:RNA polymerase sigma factor (sigma-70 family)